VYQELPLLEKLLGIENSYVPLKLFSLALVLVLSNLQLKFLSQAYLKEIIMEENKDWDRLIF
jgi:predicted Zn-dependent protease